MKRWKEEGRKKRKKRDCGRQKGRRGRLGGDKKSGRDGKRDIDKTRKGSPENTKKEDRKSRKKSEGGRNE